MPWKPLVNLLVWKYVGGFFFVCIIWTMLGTVLPLIFCKETAWIIYPPTSTIQHDIPKLAESNTKRAEDWSACTQNQKTQLWLFFRTTIEIPSTREIIRTADILLCASWLFPEKIKLNFPWQKFVINGTMQCRTVLTSPFLSAVCTFSRALTGHQHSAMRELCDTSKLNMLRVW